MTKKLVAFVTFILTFLFALNLSLKPVKASGENLIANPSAELQNAEASLPLSWSQDSWGTNTAVFNYLSEGYDGTHSLSVNLTAYTDGDAKWRFDQVQIEPDTAYTFSDNYRSDVPSSIVAQFSHTDGTVTYQFLKWISASATWKSARIDFTTDANTNSVSIFHLIHDVGGLTIDKASLSLSDGSNPNLPPQDPNNLIANNSAEIDDSNGSPENWYENSWGEIQAEFSYSFDSQDGSRSLGVAVNDYTSGDAKWIFDPVSIESNKYYVYSDYYKSAVVTHIVSQVEDNDGNLNYYYIGSLPESSVWVKSSFDFITPDNSKKITIFHLINSVGSLQIDNARLEKSNKVVITDNVPNNSLEQATDDSYTNPIDWYPGYWGENEATFSYLNDGYDQSHSVKTEITSYTSGDAKWFYQSQPVAPNKTLLFTDYYKSSITSRVVAEITNSDGTKTYIELKNAFGADNWTHYQDSFTTTSNAESITVFHLIAAVGYIVVDDYHLTDYQTQGFNRALVSLTFDDGYESFYTTSWPVMQTYNFRGTFYITTSLLNTDFFMNDSMVQNLSAAGNQISAHTFTHPHLTQLTDEDLYSELYDSQIYLQNKFGVNADDFAAPFGEMDGRVLNLVKSLYASQRSVVEGYNFANNFDIYNLYVQNVLVTTTSADIQAWLDEAKLTNAWLILVYHQNDNFGDTYSTSPENFSGQMQALSGSGLSVVTLDEALNEILPQL